MFISKCPEYSPSGFASCFYLNKKLTPLWIYITDITFKPSALTKVINWVEAMNAKLGIPEKLKEILPSTNGLCDKQLMERYHHIDNDNAILTEKDLLEMSFKAERNPTGFTNFIRFTNEDYARVLRTCL